MAFEPVHLSIEPGFEGFYKEDGIVPVKIILENRAGDAVSGEFKVLGGEIEYTFPFHLVPYSKKIEWIPVDQRGDTSPSILLSSQKNINFRKEVPLRRSIQNKGFVVYISNDHRKLQSLTEMLGKTYQVFRVSPYDLWDLWEGYKQADFVVLDNSVSEVIKEPQWNAIKRYVLAGGTLYVYGALPFSADEQKSIIHHVKGLPLLSGGRVGRGNVYLLPFNPEADASYPRIKQQDDILNQIPPANWFKEIDSVLFNLIRWNIGYLLFLIPVGFVGLMGRRKMFWSGFALLLLAGAFASLGLMNAKKQIKGTTIINIYHGEEEGLLQSKISILPVRGSKVYAEFDPPKSVSFDSDMLVPKSFVWERFGKMAPVLYVDLKVYNGKIKGIIKNLSEYPLENPAIWVNGLFSPVQSIKSGEEIFVELPNQKGGFHSYQDGLGWLKYFLDQDMTEGDSSQHVKIFGQWRKPILKLKDSNLSLKEETTVILYHL